ncbi:hypothetical protein LR48_Vigan05g082700 [Vigna angularis]|uniref:Uncharacterized protein n=1 Tax=Phaseolus angularis TaxID=3914 RepID=A0A0L9UKD6_PHAAN|nr:hypothetical protein LR48_Vigan05g082700 [Vigna angularis]
MKLMKEVKWDRDGIGKGHEKCKRRETASTAQRQLPLSGTLKDPLAPLRGRNDHTLLPLSAVVPKRETVLSKPNWRSAVASKRETLLSKLSWRSAVAPRRETVVALPDWRSTVEPRRETMVLLCATFAAFHDSNSLLLQLLHPIHLSSCQNKEK